MLVLSRKPGEIIRIGSEIKLTVIRIGPNSVWIGIDAPQHMKIMREELIEAKQLSTEPGEKQAAIQGPAAA